MRAMTRLQHGRDRARAAVADAPTAEANDRQDLDRRGGEEELVRVGDARGRERVLAHRHAGAAANFSDSSYEEAGCEVVSSADDVWSKSDIVLKVRAPEQGEESKLHANQTLISFIAPGQNPELLETLTKIGGTALAMDMVPRVQAQGW